MKKVLIGKGLIEIAVLVIILTVLIYLLSNIFGTASAKPRQATCVSHLHLITMAVMEYMQDNNNYFPGICDKNKKYVGWVENVKPYIAYGTDVTRKMEQFLCPEEKNRESVSYGVNSAILQANGMGIKGNLILKPNCVGLICDAEPINLGKNQGGIIGSITITGIGDKAGNLFVKPVSRHHIGTDDTATIVGFVDGHIKSTSNKDDKNGVNKAFYRAVELGYIKKPAK